MATASDFLRRPTLSPPPLEQFVYEGPSSMTLVSKLARSHYNPQTAFLFDMEGCPTVDFIGHLETFDRDMLYILRKLDVPELWKGYEKYGFRGHAGNDPNVFGTKYKQTHSVDFTDEMKRSVYTRYYSDFVRLGYAIEWPASVKKEIEEKANQNEGDLFHY